jgi:hypothetical protein
MSGKLQIAISGLQNEFISGKPTFSHFLSVFKKHTKFAFNVNEFPLVNAKLGEETQCIIPVDSGDLINTLTLKWKLYYKASISSEHFTDSTAHNGYIATGRTYDDPFTPNVGMHGIDYAELYIGGTLIERITSDWIYLNHSYNKADYVFNDSILYQTQATVDTNPYAPSWRVAGTGSVAKTIGTVTTTTNEWGIRDTLTPTIGSIGAPFGVEDSQNNGAVQIIGDTAVVGQGRNGRVYIYTRDTPGDPVSSWSLVDTLTGVESERFGQCISLMGDDPDYGYTLVVGSPRYSGNGTTFGGKVDVYFRSTATASFELKLTIIWGPPAGSTRTYFGTSVSIDGSAVNRNGDWTGESNAIQLAVGTWRTELGSYVYYIIPSPTTAGAWEYFLHTHIPTSGDKKGSPIAIRGEYLAFGLEGGGEVEVHKRTGGITSGTWGHHVTQPGGGSFGQSLELDTHGLGAGEARLLVGAERRQSNGRIYYNEAYVYKITDSGVPGNQNIQIINRLTPGDGSITLVGFGMDVSMKGDLIAIGNCESPEGIFIYKRTVTPSSPTGETWTYIQKITPPSGSKNGLGIDTDGINILSANVNDQVFVINKATVTTTSPVYEHTWRLKQMYIDLPFYFYNNLPASILACKLTKQNCYVKIKFKSHDKLVHPFLLPYTKDTNIESASILTKYTYLDNDELNYLKSRPIKQLITQTQLQQHDIPYNLLGDGASFVDIAAGDHLRIEIPLSLSNPIKNLYFFTVRKSRLHNKVAVYGYYPNVFNTRYEYMMTTFFKSAGLKLNGNYLFNESYSKLAYDNRLNTSLSSFGGETGYLNRQDGSGSYSFALYPTSNEPSGHLNLNRIIDKKFVLEPTFLTFDVKYGGGQNYAQMPVGEPLELNIYGTCYNMMVYSDGLCGLKY